MVASIVENVVGQALKLYLKWLGVSSSVTVYVWVSSYGIENVPMLAVLMSHVGSGFLSNLLLYIMMKITSCQRLLVMYQCRLVNVLLF